VIHRDLKPANVFLQQAGGHRVVRVLDFGVAKLATTTADVLTSSRRAAPPSERCSTWLPNSCSERSLVRRPIIGRSA